MDLLNCAVFHRTFGEGIVVDQFEKNMQKYVTVRFSEKNASFTYPAGFAGYLRCVDPKIQSEFEEFLVKKKESEKARIHAESLMLATTASPKSTQRVRNNTAANQDYFKFLQIMETLEREKPDFADEIAGINQIYATVSTGGVLGLEEHVKAMTFSLLSNMREWKAIEDNIKQLENVFCGYSIPKLMRKADEDILNEILKLKCGNLSIRSQVSHLKENIRTLQRIDRENGGIDHYYSSTDKYILVEQLSNSDSPYKLHDMGIPLVCEYLKGVGIDLVKPDRHVCRIVGRLGYSRKYPAGEIETLRICDGIADTLHLSHAMVDTVLWQYGVKEKCGICGDEPECARCGVASCPSRKA